jgi:hypothetical protein
MQTTERWKRSGDFRHGAKCRRFVETFLEITSVSSSKIYQCAGAFTCHRFSASMCGVYICYVWRDSVFARHVQTLAPGSNFEDLVPGRLPCKQAILLDPGPRFSSRRVKVQSVVRTLVMSAIICGHDGIDGHLQACRC